MDHGPHPGLERGLGEKRGAEDSSNKIEREADWQNHRAGIMDASLLGMGEHLCIHSPPNPEISVPQVTKNGENVSLEILRQKSKTGVEWERKISQQDLGSFQPGPPQPVPGLQKRTLP